MDNSILLTARAGDEPAAIPAYAPGTPIVRIQNSRNFNLHIIGSKNLNFDLRLGTQIKYGNSVTRGLGQNAAEVRREQGRPHRRARMAAARQQVQQGVHGQWGGRRRPQSGPLLPHVLVQSPHPLSHPQ